MKKPKSQEIQQGEELDGVYKHDGSPGLSQTHYSTGEASGISP